MEESTAKILSHYSNSGIVQMPGRQFPGIVMQGDSISSLHGCLVLALADAKKRRDEDTFYELYPFVKILEGQLLHYEQALKASGMRFPYAGSINDHLVADDYDEFSPT
jgi:hypothetical protein